MKIELEGIEPPVKKLRFLSKSRSLNQQGRVVFEKLHILTIEFIDALICLAQEQWIEYIERDPRKP
jgi:hypothetical protein